jgi:hypothetical protein
VITVREEEKNILQHCLNILTEIASRNKRRNDQTFNRKFRGLMATVTVRFVDNGGIVDHHY